MNAPITPQEFRQAAGVEDWRIIGEGACAYFRTGSFEAGARLVGAISRLAGIGPSQPDVDVRHDGVTVRLVTYTADHFGIGTRDVELARQISILARELGLEPDPSAVQTVLVIPGSPNPG